MTKVSVSAMQTLEAAMIDYANDLDSDDWAIGIPKILDVLNIAIAWREGGCTDAGLLEALSYNRENQRK